MVNTEILLITSNSIRYEYNTNMRDVINYLRHRQEITTLDISDFLGHERPIDLIQKMLSKKKISIILFIDGPPVLLLSLKILQSLRKSSQIAMFFGDIFAHFHSCYKYYAQVTDIALVDEDVEIGNFRKYVPNVILSHMHTQFQKFAPKHLDICMTYRS